MPPISGDDDLVVMIPRCPRIKDLKVVAAVRARDRYCQWCGSPFNGEVHHIHSRGAQGDDVPENLIVLCHEHHMAFHAGHISRRELWEILHRKYGYEYDVLAD